MPNAETTYRLTPELLAKVIEDERNGIAGYEHFRDLTPDRDALEAIDGILEDERKHLKQFTELYQRRFGKTPPETPSAAPFPHTFTGALRRAAEDELESCKFYRDIYMGNSGEAVKNPFFEAMTDESGHAARLNLLYASELEKRMM